jgi:hypothetical protein
MKINKTNLLAAIITTFATSLHLYRIMFNKQMILGEWFIPVWLSAIAASLAGYLAIHFWKNLK